MTRELSDAAALARMPHKGNMRLIDRVVSVSERQIHCIATPHNDATYPLRIDGTLFSACLVELGAQAAALHASFFDVKGNHTGLLVGLQNVEFSLPVLPRFPDPLQVFANQLHFDSNGSLYDFKVVLGSEACTTGRAALKMQGEQD